MRWDCLLHNVCPDGRSEDVNGALQSACNCQASVYMHAVSQAATASTIAAAQLTPQVRCSQHRPQAW